MSEEIAESLREISTPTGLSYSGDRTLDNSYTEEIIDYINSLQQKVEQLENMRKEAIDYMKEFIFEPLLINEDRKLIMYNENLKNFENILNKGDK